MKPLIEIANQLHALEKKMSKESNATGYLRHIQRIRQSLQDMGITYHNPEGEKYTDTRTDIEATLTGEPGAQMVISETIKPIVMQGSQIVQTGIVIVEN